MKNWKWDVTISKPFLIALIVAAFVIGTEVAEILLT